MKKDFIFTHDYNEILLSEVKAILSNKHNSKILNIACEYNLIPEFLKESALDFDVYGVEINEDVVKANPKVRFCNVDESSLPFDSQSFDLILSIWGIEHFQSENIFKEAEKILKMNGHMIFLTPNILNPLFFINKFSKGFASKTYFKYLTDSKYKPHKTHYIFNNERAIEKVAARNGLKLTKITYLGPSFYTKYFEFNKLLKSIVVAIDKCITNPLLGYFKPYLICVLEK